MITLESAKRMTTLELAKVTVTKYFLNCVTEVDEFGHQYYMWQLVQTDGCTILYTDRDFRNVKIECWERGISKELVTLW